MGGKSNGVTVRDSSIRLSFTFEGKREFKTLMLNDEPMPPTQANIKYAHRVATEIKEKIRHQTFSLVEYFPASGNSGALTVGKQMDTWLATQRIEQSTRAGYVAAINFWKIAKLEDKPVRALKHSDILAALATRPDLTGKTLNNYISVLREALELAKKDRLITENPAAEVPRDQAPEGAARSIHP